PATGDQIGTLIIEVLVDQEVFLFRPDGGEDAGSVLAKNLKDAKRLRGERLHRLEQRGLLVQRLTGPAQERGRDDQRRAVGILHDVSGGGWIPRGIAARFEGR